MRTSITIKNFHPELSEMSLGGSLIDPSELYITKREEMLQKQMPICQCGLYDGLMLIGGCGRKTNLIRKAIRIWRTAALAPTPAFCPSLPSDCNEIKRSF